MAYGPSFDRALALASELHRNQVRKGTGIPYVTHLLAVAALVAEYGGEEDQVIAALLHDAVEDQGGEAMARRILDEFGPAVHRIVMACSDSVVADPTKKEDWWVRKRRYLGHLGMQGPDVKLVSAADKLHNARSIALDLRVIGPGIWSRFRTGQDGQRFFYDGLLEALRINWDNPVLLDLERVVAEIWPSSGTPRPL